VEWGGLWQRPHHLAHEFSKRFKSVVYLQPAGLRNPRLSDIKRIKGFLTPKTSNYQHVQYNKTFQVKRLPFVPIQNLSIAELINAKILDKFLTKIHHSKEAGPCLLWLAAPVPFLKRSLILSKRLPTIFDWIDDYAIFHHLPKQVVDMQYKLLSMVDIVFASSKILVNKALKYRKKDVVYLPNGVDITHWNCKKNGELRRHLKLPYNSKIVGYFGTISHWIDKELVLETATKRPELIFVFIGPRADQGLLDSIFRLKNCIHITQVSYQRLPELACDFDVCWMPFLVNDLTKTINPVKVYEYLAMGKPVVVPSFPDLEEVSDVLYLASSPLEWQQALEKAITMPNHDLENMRRTTVTKGYSWEHIAQKALEALLKANILTKGTHV